MNDTWRWGVAGPGGIAARFADVMTVVDGGTVHAVASRSAERAAAYADRFDVPVRHVDYESLAADPDVDVVYVATLPASHEDQVRLFIEAGKPVLCEKPFALDATQATAMADLARERGTFLMEAMWSRFLPAWTRLVDLVGEGRIGDVRLVEASLGFPFPADSRVFDRATGGGALLDLGVYPLNLAAVVLGQPDSVAATGALTSGGVDEHSAVVLGHAGGAAAVATASITVGLPCTGRVTGTAGAIDLPAMFHCPSSLTVSAGGRVERIDCGFEGDGLRFEIEEVQRCLAAGRTESEAMPLAETVAVMRTLDAVRAQLGVDHRADAQDAGG